MTYHLVVWVSEITQYTSAQWVAHKTILLTKWLIMVIKQEHIVIFTHRRFDI